MRSATTVSNSNFGRVLEKRLSTSTACTHQALEHSPQERSKPHLHSPAGFHSVTEKHF